MLLILKYVVLSILLALIILGYFYLTNEFCYQSEWRWEQKGNEDLYEVIQQGASIKLRDAGKLSQFLRQAPTPDEIKDYVTKLYDSYYPSVRVEKSLPENKLKWTSSTSLWLLMSEAFLSRNIRSMKIYYLGTHMMQFILRIVGTIFLVIVTASMAYTLYFTGEVLLGLCMGLTFKGTPKKILSRKYQNFLKLRDILLIGFSIIYLISTIVICSFTYGKYSDLNTNQVFAIILFRLSSFYPGTLLEDGYVELTTRKFFYLLALQLLLNTATTLFFFSILNFYKTLKNTKSFILTNEEYRHILKKKYRIDNIEIEDKKNI